MAEILSVIMDICTASLHVKALTQPLSWRTEPHAPSSHIPVSPVSARQDTCMACCCNRPTALQSSSDSVAQSFYFATIRDATQPGSQRRGSSCWIPNRSDLVPAPLPQVPGMPGEVDAFAAVVLGTLLGHGGSGHVYRGLWNGATVAVKVMTCLRAD